MKKVGLIDVDSKIINLPLMKLSTWHKQQGHEIILNPTRSSDVDMVYCSVLFSWNRAKALKLKEVFPGIIQFGGTGWDLTTNLPDEIEGCLPDYDLYTVDDIAPRIGGIMTKAKRLQKAQAIVKAGIGFLSRGCVNRCSFCVVPKKEGPIRKVGEIKDLINPRSNVVIILDANLTAQPECLDILTEIKERGLVIDLTQGLDVRSITPEIARALASVKHLRSVHYSWDNPSQSSSVLRGIAILSQHVKKYRHLCFTLVGYNTTFSEDMYRFRKLTEIGVDPFVMIFNRLEDRRLRHFARWVNGRIYKVCPNFNDYTAWAQGREAYFAAQQPTLFAA